MSFFIHPSGICESGDVGADTKIWAFAHVLKGARIGSNCNICDGVFIENDVVVGNNVTVKYGVQLWDGLRVEDDVFIGPNATFVNDLFPRSKVPRKEQLETRLRKRCSIGANATVLGGVTIGEDAMVGAGAVIVRSVPPSAIVVGNPGRIVGYAGVEKVSSTSVDLLGPASERIAPFSGVRLIELPRFADLRGQLCVGELDEILPFRPRRFFVVFDVPSREVRGEHAHKECHQLLISTKGEVTVVTDDGSRKRQFLLNSPHLGLYVPPMVWTTQYKYSADAALLVLASHPYADSDYIRDYHQFQMSLV